MLAAEPGYEFLPQIAALSAYGFRLGGDLALLLETEGIFVAPSAYAESGYRYRGFQAGAVLAGTQYRYSSYAFSLLAGGALARYGNSDSYFFFPVAELRAEYAICDFPKGYAASAGLSLPLFLRTDVFGLGLGMSLTLSHALDPPTGGRP